MCPLPFGGYISSMVNLKLRFLNQGQVCSPREIFLNPRKIFCFTTREVDMLLESIG